MPRGLDRKRSGGPISRRYFLRALGAGAVASSASTTLLARVVQAQPTTRRFVIREDRFGRLSDFKADRADEDQS